MSTEPLTPGLAQRQAIIAQTQSFGLGRYPLGFWNLANLTDHGVHFGEEAAEDWQEAGFTVPMSPALDPTQPAQVAQMRRLLDACGDRGQKLILNDPRVHAGNEAPDYDEQVRGFLADFGDHPALFGPFMGDEPPASRKVGFFADMRRAKELAPHLHPYGNLNPWDEGLEELVGTDTWPHYLDEYATQSGTDLISYDAYKQMNDGEAGIHNYYENLRLYREASWRHGLPFWNTVLSVGHFRYRCPSYDDLRWQFMTSVAAGAHGVTWFFYYLPRVISNFRLSPVDELWDRTPTWGDLRRVQHSFHQTYGDLFTRLVSTRVSFLPWPYGHGQRWTPNELLASVKADRDNHPLLVGEFADLNGGRYVMVVNNSQRENVSLSLVFPGAGVRLFSYDRQGREVEGPSLSSGGIAPVEGGLLSSHWLAPGQEAFYRVEGPVAAGPAVL
ncbi:MAG TPA: hypothetical protein VGM19_02205 [Armatimonadota bacterium]|jgi:hypothetical protein